MKEDGSPECSGQKWSDTKEISEMLHAFQRNWPKHPFQILYYQKHHCKKIKYADSNHFKGGPLFNFF